MSVAAVRWALDPVNPARGTDRLVLVALADFANGDGYAWPRMSVLADRAGVTRSTVWRSLGRLVDAGLVEVVVSGAAAGSSNTYRVCVDGGQPVDGVPVDGDRGVALSRQGCRAVATGGVALSRHRTTKEPSGTYARAREGTGPATWLHAQPCACPRCEAGP